MKRGCPTHPKTEELAELLGIEIFAAVGLLEMLWHFTAQYAPRGDIGQWPDKRIAKALGWRRDAEKLVSAMVSAGWLDTDPAYRLLVHGWAEHADQGVARLLARRNQSFAVPVTSYELDMSSEKLDVTSLARARAVAVAVHKPKPEPSPWPDGAFDDAKAMWSKRSGGTPRVAAMSREWTPLVVDHGFLTFRAALSEYLADTPIKFLSVSRFAETFGEWKAKALPKLSPASTTVPSHMTPEFREAERQAMEKRKASA